MGLQVRRSKPTTKLENEPLVAVSEVRGTARVQCAGDRARYYDLIIRESRTSPSFAGAQS
jgi:hypothetical protein